MSDESLMPWKNDPEAKMVSLAVAGGEVRFPVTAAALAQEMRDQSDLKKPHRSAILRKSAKQLKALHKSAEKLNEKQKEEYMFTAFIMWVNSQIDGDHLEIRGGELNPAQKAETICDAL